MPKTRVAPRPTTEPIDHLPLWDALVAELRDPRPYEPTTISSPLVVPCDLMNEFHDGLVEAFDRLDDDVSTAFASLADVGRDAVDALDAIYPWPEPPVVDDASSALALLDVESTQVLPAWPTAVDVDEPRGEAS